MSASTGKRSSRAAEPADPAPISGAVLAEPGQRLVARLIDTLIVGPPVALVARALLPEPAYGARPAETATAIGLAVVYLLYDTVQHALWGRTIGKRLTGIHVVAIGAAGGQGGAHGAVGGRVRMGLPRALLRAAIFALPIAARPVPVLSVIAGIFWVANAGWVLEGTRRQALHDRLAGTAVIRGGPAQASTPTSASTPAS
ncbi:MAG TPA: RDD family protein [Streptosporangiaceae bacterium]|nr:RDD family protein [Streptosporangiaceae bacterium]